MGILTFHHFSVMDVPSVGLSLVKSLLLMTFLSLFIDDALQ
jgi:hypothetical protein